MSFWTHFIGTMQFCARSYEDVEAVLGKPTLFHDVWDWDDDEERTEEEIDRRQEELWAPAFRAWRDGTGMPMGSEGSLNWKYIDTSKENDHVFGEGTLVAIEGDLRDFGCDIEDIRKSMLWFRSKCFALGTRTAVLRINADWYHFVIYGHSTRLVVHAFEKDELILSYSWRYHRKEEQWYTDVLFDNLPEDSNLIKDLIPEIIH